MSQPFIGEIRIFGFTFAPRNYAFCQGQLIQIQQNEALFAIIGTTYGGNGQTTFALPDMRGRVPMHWGQGPGLSNYDLGEMTGSENVTLLLSQIPMHSHNAGCSNGTGDSYSGGGAVPATDAGGNNVYSASSGSTMNGSVLSTAGSNFPHTNIQPFLAVNYCVALYGIFPSRN